MTNSEDQPKHHLTDLGADQLELIDEICLQFDRRWSEGRPPSIEAVLQGADGAFRRRLLDELLRVDIEYRRRGPEPVSMDDYRGRFEADKSVVESVLAEVFGGRADLDTSLHSRAGDDTDRRVTSRNWSPLTLPAHLGCYELVEVLGEGGMGIVYRAREYAGEQVLREVAVKLIRPDRWSAGNQLQELKTRFLDEARNAARVHHENIVPLYAYGELASQPFLSMRLMTGGSLEESLHSGPLTAKQAATLMVHVANAIETLHDHDITHRDIKPRNILFDEEGRPHVTDFGLARWGGASDDLTQTGCPVGTPMYMSPEQACGKSLDRRSDIYSLGATLYELLTGRPPFRASSLADTLRQVTDDEPVPPRRLNSGTPRDLETICLKCLEKNPARRYSTAKAFADDLVRYLQSRPIQARRHSVFVRIGKWSRRSPWAATAMALLVLVSVVSPAIAVIQSELAQRNAALSRNLDAKNQELSDINRRLTDAIETIRDQQTDLRRSLLNSDLPRIQTALQAGNVRDARRNLSRHIPKEGETDLRSFAWHWLWSETHHEVESRTIEIAPETAFPSPSHSTDGKLFGVIGGTLQHQVVELATGRIWQPRHEDLVRDDLVNPSLKRIIQCRTIQFTAPDTFVTVSIPNVAVTTSPPNIVNWIDVSTWRVEPDSEGRRIELKQHVTLDSRRLLSSNPSDDAVGKWTLPSRMETLTLRSMLAVGPRGRSVATIVGTASVTKHTDEIVLWDTQTGMPTDRAVIHAAAGACFEGQLAFSPQRKLVVFADKMGTIHSWRVSQDNKLQPLGRLNEPPPEKFHGVPQITSLAFSLGDSEQFYMGDATGRVWDVAPVEQRIRQVKQADGNAVTSMCWMDDGQLALGRENSLIELYERNDTSELQFRTRYQGHEAEVLWVSHANVDSGLLSLDRDGKLKRWPQPEDVNSAVEKTDILAITPDFTLAARTTEERGENEYTQWLSEFQSVARDVQKLAQADDRDKLREAQQRLQVLREKKGTLNAVMPPLQRNVQVRNRQTGAVCCENVLPKKYTGRIELAQFLDDQLLLVVGIERFRHTVYVHNVASDAQVHTHRLAPNERVLQVAYCPLGRLLAVATTKEIKLIRCWKAGTAIITYPVSQVVGLSVIGSNLTALTHSGKCISWDLRDEAPALRNERLLDAEGHRWWFLAGSKRAVSADKLGKLRLWDLDQAKVTYEYHGLRKSIDAVCPDGKTFAAQGEDGKLWLCDVETGEERLFFDNRAGVLRFRSDGYALATEKTIWQVRNVSR